MTPGCPWRWTGTGGTGSPTTRTSRISGRRANPRRISERASRAADGAASTSELKKEVQDYVKAHTAPYKYPRIVVFRDELPKTPTGKIMRSKL